MAGSIKRVPTGDDVLAHARSRAHTVQAHVQLDEGLHAPGQAAPATMRTAQSVDGGAGVPSLYGSPLEPSWTIRRPELTAVLDDGRAVTIVRGGSGFGKTMLVAQWAARAATAGVWIDVDDDVSDRLTFWARLFAMVQDSGQAPLDEKWLPSPDQIMAGGDLRRHLIRFASHFSAPFVIVIDNAHDLGDGAVEDDVRAMLRVTDRLRVVIVTRGMSSFDRKEHGADLDIVEIEPRRLLFTARECALVIVRSVLTVDAKLAHEVHAITGGMPLATRLVAELLDGTNRLSTSRETDAVIDRVAEALVASAGVPGGPEEEEFWSFLQRASLLDGVTADEAARLGGAHRHAAREWLDRARSLGFGFWESDGDEPRFHFVPITARVLERSATPPDRSNTANAEAAAAEVLWSRGDARAAWARAVRTEQFALAERILRESFTIVSDDVPSAFEPLLAVGTSKLRRFPFLTALLGVAHARSGNGRAVGSAYLSNAEQFARSRMAEASGDERLAMLAVRLVALRLDGRWAPALSVAADVSAAAERAELDHRRHTPDVLASTLLQAALTFADAGQHASALRAAERALSVSGIRAESVSAIHGVLAGIHALGGSIPRVEEHLSAREQPGVPSTRSSWAELATVLLLLESADFEATLDALDALAVSSNPEMRVRSIPVRALVDAAQGRSLTSIATVSDAVTDRDRIAVPPAVRSSLNRSIVVLYLAVGALAHAKSAIRSFEKGDPASAIGRAQIALIEDKALDAVAGASDALAIPTLRPRDRAELLLARAAASLRLGGERAAIHDLSEALRVLDGNGLRTPWMFLVESDRLALGALADGAGLLRPELLERLESVPVLFTRLDSIVELTGREREVLTLLVSGLSVSVIARQLVVSPNTVKKQRASIYRKLGATTREEAAIAAIARGLLDR
ncbi:LuxR family transcriptional regulator [Labedella populi]|uniref:LuxR family transcriptional regulator n=1 Tax=Labedella populi TaxID=2498850 RepID=A0A3S4AGK2_9MICO|nr:LuxR family transcriptional regulator [Labedella populi]RWZ68394.1 LuxR family transcriptional regulator [Labedella populi]